MLIFASREKSIFQSTCLREARRYSATELVELNDFNPRAYVRHDLRIPERQ